MTGKEGADHVDFPVAVIEALSASLQSARTAHTARVLISLDLTIILIPRRGSRGEKERATGCQDSNPGSNP